MSPAPCLRLSHDKVVVVGAKHAVLIDFSRATTRRLDAPATRAIKRALAGRSSAQGLDTLKTILTPSEIDSVSRPRSSAHLPTASPPTPPQFVPVEPQLDFLWIEVTARCNLRCVHCYSGSKADLHPGLPGKTLKTLIDQAAALGCGTIQFTGGECLLRPDLRELVEHASNRRIGLIEVFTNATHLTEPLIEFFAAQQIRVALSLHSYRPEVHDLITGVPGSFRQTLTALELLLAYEVPTRCSTIAMKQNEPDLDGTTYFLSQIGVACQPPDPIRPSGRGTKPENWPETYGRRFLQTQPLFPVSAETFERNSIKNSCWHGKAAVTSAGDVIPCVFARDQIAGRFPARTLGQIIGGKRMRSYWSLTYARVRTCKGCEYRYLCTDCRPLALGLTGNLYAKSPRCTYDPRTGLWGSIGESPAALKAHA